MLNFASKMTNSVLKTMNFGRRALIELPNYNWRMLTLLSIIPTVILTTVAFFVIDESPRWVLIAKGMFSY